MSKPFLYFLLLFLTLGFSSCRRSKLQKSIAQIPKQEEAPAVVVEDSIVVELPKLEPVVLNIDEVGFNYLKLKSKIDFQSDNFNQSFPATVHIKKDSVIWISVAVGIEAARCLITQDSIKMLDRINRKYYHISIRELSEQFHFDFDFRLLQSLLVGNLPFPRLPHNTTELHSLYTSLFQELQNVKVENQIDNLNHKLSTILAEDKSGSSKLGVSYLDFTPEQNGQLVPHAIFAKIDVTKNETVKTSILDIKHNKFEFSDSELKFPYQIPKSYSKGEIVF